MQLAIQKINAISNTVKLQIFAQSKIKCCVKTLNFWSSSEFQRYSENMYRVTVVQILCYVGVHFHHVNNIINVLELFSWQVTVTPIFIKFVYGSLKTHRACLMKKLCLFPSVSFTRVSTRTPQSVLSITL